MLYLFLLWVARSALKDLRRDPRAQAAPAGPAATDATGMHSAARGLGPDRRRAERRGCASSSAPGCASGSAYDLIGGACSAAATRPTSSSRTRSPPPGTRALVPQGDVMVLEDLGSTNGTYLNGEPLRGPQPLHVGDRIRIGDSEFSFER